MVHRSNLLLIIRHPIIANKEVAPIAIARANKKKKL